MSTDQIESELRSIEHALHAALVRQLRVISLMAVLLGVAGYFVGHFVAEEQSRSDVAPLTAQIEELQQQLHERVAAVAERCDRQETAYTNTLSALHQLEILRRDEAARDAAAINALLTDIENRRSMSVRELESYVTSRVTMPPEAVTAAINRFVDEHTLQLDRVLSVLEHRLNDETIARTRAPSPPNESPAITTAPPRSTPPTLSNPVPAPPAPPKVAAATREPQGGAYFAPPERKPLLFFNPRQAPQRLDPVRISESEEIPLPPR